MSANVKRKGQGKWGKADSFSSTEDETSASDFETGKLRRDKNRKSPPGRQSNSRWDSATAVSDYEEDDVDEPLQIVHFGKIRNGKVSMTVDDDSLEKVMKSAGDFPLCIINIVGPPNLGKGFVLNIILRKLEAMQGGDRNWMGWDNGKVKFKRFAFGNHGEEKDLKSAGINVWPQPFIIESDEGRIAVLVMETNGLHYDAFDSLEALTSIFCLSFLTSSILIYNTCENELTEDAFMPWISYLRFGKKILDAFDSFEDKPFQTFSFLIRDWSNPQEYGYGETDGKKYLFEQVEQQLDNRTQKHVTKALKEYFTTAGCFLLPSAGEHFKNADFDGSLENLDGEFVKKLEKYIGGLVSPTTLYVKKIYKNKMTASNFKEFLSAYVLLMNSYNRGSDTVSGDSLHKVSLSTLAESIISTTVADYRKSMENGKNSSTYIDDNSLHKMHGNAKKQAEVFLRTALPQMPSTEMEECRKKLAAKISDVFENLKEENLKNRTAFITENVYGIFRQYEQRLSNKIALDEEYVFYEENDIQMASSSSLNIKQHLFDSCLSENDEDFEDIKKLVTEKVSKFLNSLIQKNARNRQRAESVLARFNEELQERYKSEMQESSEETIDVNSLKFIHRTLKKAAVKDFRSRQSTFPGNETFQEAFLNSLENSLDELFRTYETGEQERFQEQQQRANWLVLSLKSEYEGILRSKTNLSMTQEELDEIHQKASTDLLERFRKESPFPSGSTNGELLRQTLQRDLDSTNQNYVIQNIQQQKKLNEAYKKARDHGVKSYIEAMEDKLKSGFIQTSDLEQLHLSHLKQFLKQFDEKTNSLEDAREHRTEMDDRIREAFENFKVANTESYKQANADAEKLLNDVQQQYISRMSQGKYGSKSDVEGAHKQCLDEYYKQLSAKLGGGHEELKKTYFEKIKGLVQSTYQQIAGTVEIQNEKERLQFFELLQKARQVYHDEMAKKCSGHQFQSGRELERIHHIAVDNAISSGSRALKMQVSNENRKRLVNAMEDSFTKYQIQYTMGKSNQTQSPAIGIDLGTTYCCVAVIWKDQKMKIVLSSEGDTTTPSYVAFHDDDSHVIGQPAKDDSYRNPENTVFDAKRMIGRRMTDKKLQNDMKFWPFTVVEHNGVPKINIRGKPHPPEHISAVLLRNLKAQAEEQLGVRIDKAVITVPAYFDDGQRAATVDAGEMAGLKVLTILNEPTAAAIAYKMEQFSDLPRKVLVYDLGGGTFDVAVLQTGAKSIDVLGVDGDTHLGGEDFDKNLMEECVKVFREKTGVDLLKDKDSYLKPKKEEARRILRRLQTYSEKAKRQLSSALQATISVDAIADGKDLYAVISRARFEEINHSLFQKTIDVVQKALNDAHVRKEEIDDVLLVGGSTRIPKIREMLSKYFNDKTLSHSVHPDTAVAHGAAVQAALLNGGNGEKLFSFESIRDVTPMSLGIEANIGNLKDRFSIIIPKNTKIPHQATETYRTTADNQDVMRISVYQGEHDIAKDNSLLGTFRLTGIPSAKAGAESVDVNMKIDKMGILHVAAVCNKTKNMKSLTVQANKGRLSAKEKKEIAVAIEKVTRKPVVENKVLPDNDHDDSNYEDWFTSAAHGKQQLFDALDDPLEE